ncbi:MAG: hypothetical protein ACYC7J_19565 [Syntrophales bacterium]
MIGFPGLFSKAPNLKQLPLKRYLVNLSLGKLVFGVDGIHIDVHISPQVYTAAKRAVAAAMIKHGRLENFFAEEKKEHREHEKIALRQVCTDALRDGINRAKSESEVQIDFLGQAALAKLVLEEVRNEYRKTVASLEALVRTSELSRNFDQLEWLKAKEKLAEIKQSRQRIVRLAGEELFHVLADVQARNLKDIRESNFPAEYILPDGFFINPTLHADDVADDFLLMDAYVLISQRSNEPDTFSSLKSIVDDLMGKTDLGRESSAAERKEAAEPAEEGSSSAGERLDHWLRGSENIDLMFDCFASRERYQKAKQGKEAKAALRELKARIRIQEKMLTLFYRRFKKAGLLKLIVAAYEMKAVYRSCCPPLRPLQVREYLVKRGARKPLARELKRRKLNGNTLAALQDTIRRIKGCSTQKKKEHLLSFLKDFLRYHRDLENGRLLRQAMEAVNLVTDEKMLLLSKKNRLLYEYLLPEERGKEEKPIISHVIIKADIRGSMDITHTMRTRGLNPASYFSLNFFDPISEIIRDYNASKVFIEGDAIILSIFENEDTAQGWYSVARACGLAVSMLHIVQHYNEKNRKHDLPALELGIGICYKPTPPAFLFDGDSRIMISHAINLADRLSGCDKRLRKRFRNNERPFNLYVYQHRRDEELEATADDLSLRYNVNGVELDPEGFAKLSREINLKRIGYPGERNEEVTLYTGKVPTLSGAYQRIVIREAPVLKVNPESLEVIGPTARKYYEVCTQPAIYQFIDTHA